MVQIGIIPRIQLVANVGVMGPIICGSRRCPAVVQVRIEARIGLVRDVTAMRSVVCRSCTRRVLALSHTVLSLSRSIYGSDTCASAVVVEESGRNIGVGGVVSKCAESCSSDFRRLAQYGPQSASAFASFSALMMNYAWLDNV